MQLQLKRNSFIEHKWWNPRQEVSLGIRMGTSHRNGDLVPVTIVRSAKILVHLKPCLCVNNGAPLWRSPKHLWCLENPCNSPPIELGFYLVLNLLLHQDISFRIFYCICLMNKIIISLQYNLIKILMGWILLIFFKFKYLEFMVLQLTSLWSIIYTFLPNI